jgi:WD40 repeat protein
MPDVFISYKRSDAPFVRRLFERMEEEERDVWIDWEDIPPTTDWLEEIYEGIEAADNFVFVISPDSVVSEVCNLEIAHAIDQNKRLVPILYRPVNEKEMAREIDGRDYEEMVHDNWSAIKHVNWIFFDDPNKFEASYRTLVDALETNIDYVKEHTRLLVKAREWDKAGRNPSFLLRGDELHEAEMWLAQSASEPMDASPLHHEYILESQHAASTRQRTILGAITLGLAVSVILTIISIWQFTVAQENEEEALQNEERAIAAQQEAVAAQATAEARLLETQRTQSRLLADISSTQLEEGSFQVALLIALEAVANFTEGIVNFESSTALLNALLSPVMDVADFDHLGRVEEGLWNADGTLILSWMDNSNQVNIWSVDAPNEELPVELEDNINGAAWLGDERRFVTWAGEVVQIWTITDSYGEGAVSEFKRFPHIGTVESGRVGGNVNEGTGRLLTWIDDQAFVWDISREDQLFVLNHGEATVSGAAWNSDATRILTWSEDGIVRVWNALNGSLVGSLAPVPDSEGRAVRHAEWSQDDSRILTWDDVDSVRIWEVGQQEVALRITLDDVPRRAVWSPNEAQVLVFTERDQTIEVYDVTDADEPLFELFHNQFVDDAIWNRDGTRVLSWGQSDTLRLWDGQSGNLLRFFQHDGTVNGAFWDEETIVSWSQDTTVRLWDSESGDEVRRLPHLDPVEGAAWNHDETLMLSWANNLRNGGIRVWDFTTSSDVLVYTHDELQTAKWSPDEEYVLTVSENPGVMVWSTARLEEDTGENAPLLLAQLSPEPADDNLVGGGFWQIAGNRLRILTWSNVEVPEPDCVICQHQIYLWTWDGATATLDLVLNADNLNDANLPIENVLWLVNRQAIVARTRNTVWRWDLSQPTQPVPLLEPEAAVELMVPRHNGQQLLILSADGQMQLLDVQSGATVQTFTHPDVLGAEWSPNEDRLLSWGEDGAVRIWDAGSGQQLAEFQHENAVRFATWNQAGTDVLSTSDDTTVRVWQVGSSEVVFSGDHLNPVVGAAWNPAETHILSWSNDSPFCRRDCEYEARIWEIASDSAIVLDHQDTIIGAEWNSDGSHILTVSEDGGARLWDGQTGNGRLIVQHPPPQPGLSATMLGADLNQMGDRLLTWANDDSSRLWLTDVPELIERAEERSVRELTNEEREEFFLPTQPTPTPVPDEL